MTIDDGVIICQLGCDHCKEQFAGSWRQTWTSKKCRKCGQGNVKPVISYEVLKRIRWPYGTLLN